MIAGDYHDGAWRIILPFNRYRNLWRPGRVRIFMAVLGSADCPVA
jgi:hypothetical protein